MKRLIAGIVAVLSFPLSFSFVQAEEQETLKIMSVGDSITDGYGTDGSYRKFMYHELTESGYSIDMTGPNWSWGDAVYTDSESGESFSYDAAHCGYSGYSIMEYSGRNGILETLKSGNYLSEYNPDIVILQIGTNDVIDNYDIDNAGERLEILVDYILDNVPEDTSLYVTTIPYLEPNRTDVYEWFGNYRHSADWQTNYTDDEVESAVHKQVDNYNTQVKELISKKQSDGIKNIYQGDINSILDDVSAQLKDGVHPNDTGYKLMGEYWAEIIKQSLNNNNETGETTTIQTEETSTETEETTIQTEETTTATEDISGDIDSDNAVTIKDVLLLKKYLLCINDLNENQKKAADMNTDGNIDVIDLVLLKHKSM